MQSFAILPAAGRSIRMGAPKLLLPWQGAPMLTTVLANWCASRVERLLLVVHPEDHELAALGNAAGAVVIAPTVPPPDMKASVRAGLAWLAERAQPDNGDVWLLAPADMPLLNAANINAVLDAHRVDDPRIVIPCHAGRRGHPVLFPWSMVPDVGELEEHEGLNALVARARVRELPVDDAGVLADIDTPDDYRRLAGESESG